MKPKISVIMTAYNEERYIGEAVDSILNQTFSDFELIIINDGSTDKTQEILESINDQRVKLIKNHKNVGTSASGNIGLKLARGEFIAIADADDIYFPNRFEKQINKFEENPEIDICGAWAELFFEDGRKSVLQYRHEDGLIKSFLLFNPHLAHPSLMIRRSVIEKHQIFYDEKYLKAKDYEWYTRLLDYVKAYNIQEVLLTYRKHSGGLTHNDIELQKYAGSVRKNMLRKFGIEFSNKEFQIHQAISSVSIPDDITFEEVNSWLEKLKKKNELIKYFQEPYFSQVLAYHLLKFCENAPATCDIWDKFNNSRFRKFIELEESSFNLLKLIKIFNQKGFSEIAIFGTSRMGRFLFQQLSKNGFKIICYIDNNPELTNKYLDGVKIIKSDDICRTTQLDAIIVSILGEHDKLIKENLKKELFSNDIEIFSWKEFRDSIS